MELQLSHMPVREQKPRNTGITVITDYGFGLAEIERQISESSNLIDLVKISISALHSKTLIKERLAVYKKAGISVLMSGTLFEACYLRDELDLFYKFIYENEFAAIEISESIIQIENEKKGEIIHRLADDFKVISELGYKQNSVLTSSILWNSYLRSDLEAGAWKILLEGGETGKSYIFDSHGFPRESRINSIASKTDIENLIWETSDFDQQLWFVLKYGVGVNLANIRPEELTRLESLRLGLHSETFFNEIPQELHQGLTKAVDPFYDYDPMM
jgi:phosphosulfolactate synthase